MKPSSNAYLYLTVFTSGMTSLAIEMAASHLLGAAFGSSNLVWASIIGLILVFLTLGYFLGGGWADRSPSLRTFFTILIMASLFTALVPVLARPVLRLAANAFDQLNIGILAGSFIACILLLSIPTTLLGTASPFAIRLALQDNSRVGHTSGQIYAISTLGSFIGTFIPSLILIPLIGTARTFIAFASVLLLVALIGLGKTYGWRAMVTWLWVPFLFIALYFWGLPGGLKNTTGQIYETESAYNYIQVLQQDQYTFLRLNEGQGIHSIYHPTQMNFFGPWEQVSVAPFFNPAPVSLSNVKRMAIVGLAAGTAARQATEIYGEIPIDGYEIDPKIVDVGRKYFDMNEPNLNIFIQDGRVGLNRSPHLYQVISIDAYRPPYIPWHMTTQEFFKIVYDHLTPDGVAVINVGRSPDNRSLINTLGSTMRVYFPSVHVVDIPNSFNSILFATVQPTTSANLIVNLANLETMNSVSPLLLDSVRVAVANLQPDPLPAQVFTDDLAPIEWITNNMVLNFLVSSPQEGTNE